MQSFCSQKNLPLPSSLGLPYDATYLTNGLLDYANSYGVQATHTYDARGRLSTRSQQRTADSTVLLSESLEWTPRNKIAAYTQDRIGRSWEQQKDYSYNPRGQLIDQNYLTDTSARTDAAYEYDADGLGVLQAQRFSGSTQQNWQGLDPDENTDGDSLTALEEYQQGHLPTVADADVDYYVDQSQGDDALYNGQSAFPGAPTVAHGPKHTVSSAITAAADTNVIFLQSGTYDETTLSLNGKNLTLRLNGPVTLR